jgi:muconate cycloisomerase
MDFRAAYARWGIASGHSMEGGVGYVLVTLRGSDGTVGRGEVGRFFEHETQDSILHFIGRYLGPELIGADALNIVASRERMNNILEGNAWAKSAIEMAIYDLVGRSLGVPVWALLGGSHRDVVPLSSNIGIKETPEQAVELALEHAHQGFGCVKVKIGEDFKRDTRVLASVREALGPDVAIRVDANQAYTPDEAIRRLRQLEAHDLLLIEQPVELTDLPGMARVCRAMDTPIMACESAVNPQAVLAIAMHEAADIINVKPGRPGGLYGARKMIDVAEAANLGICIGTMMELGVAPAANLHLAASAKRLNYPCDFVGALAVLVDDILEFPLDPIDGALRVPVGPGLGVEVDEDRVARYRTVDLPIVQIGSESRS